MALRIKFASVASLIALSSVFAPTVAYQNENANTAGLHHSKAILREQLSSQNRSPPDQYYRVAIVGGGIAGITAARTLAKKGIGPIVVLEGGNQLGGRARSHRMDDDVVVQEGANWIHGVTEDSPIYAIAKEQGIEGMMDEDDFEDDWEDDGWDEIQVRNAQTGADMTEKFMPCSHRFEAIFQNMVKSEKKGFTERGTIDIAMREALEKYGWNLTNSLQIDSSPLDVRDKDFAREMLELEKLAEWWVVDYNYGDSAEKLSLKDNVVQDFMWDDFGGGNYLVTDKRGLGEVLIKGIMQDMMPDEITQNGMTGALANGPWSISTWGSVDVTEDVKNSTFATSAKVPVDVKLKSVVVAIEQVTSGEQKSRIAGTRKDSRSSEKAEDSQDKSAMKPRMRIQLESGGTIFADRVLVTPSIGVLQSGLIKFIPELSRAKVEALNQVVMVCFMKLFVYWKTPWLDIQTEIWNNTLLVNHASGIHGSWPIVARIPQEDGLLLMLPAVADEGRRVENDGTFKVIEEVMMVLQASFPEYQIPMPDKHFITSWSRDRLFKGAFSVLEPGVPDSTLVELQRPEGNVWFAGEAIHKRYGGFLQGAYFSGVETAEKIAKTLGTI